MFIIPNPVSYVYSAYATTLFLFFYSNILNFHLIIILQSRALAYRMKKVKVQLEKPFNSDNILQGLVFFTFLRFRHTYKTFTSFLLAYFK
jgi:hypothetical protein